MSTSHSFFFVCELLPFHYENSSFFTEDTQLMRNFLLGVAVPLEFVFLHSVVLCHSGASQQCLCESTPARVATMELGLITELCCVDW